MLLQDIRRDIRRYGLLKRDDHVLVCVSGGADSMALLRALHELAPELGIRLTAAHMNHCLRGGDSDQDENFVMKTAEELGIECIAARRDIKRLAKTRGQSLEMAGREARYDFFSRAARSTGCDVAATAHNSDDQAETILMRLARGSGGRGLRGIARSTSWQGLRIVRPLRDVNRSAIISYLERNRISWREDASNQDKSFLRNRVRHEIIPILETKLNPQLRKALVRLGDIMEEENAWLDSLAARILTECAAPSSRHSASGRRPMRKNSARHRHMDIIRAKLLICPAPARRRVLRQWLVSCGLSHESLDFETTNRLDGLLTSTRTARSLTLAGGWVVRREYGRIKISEAGGDPDPEPYSTQITVPGETVLQEQGLKISASIEPGVFRDKTAAIGVFPAHASLAIGALSGGKITARTWRPGDRIKPVGMKGSRKIQDIFVDMRISKPMRHSVPLFECCGEIIWLPGYRIARDWALPDGSSGRALQLRVEALASSGNRIRHKLPSGAKRARD